MESTIFVLQVQGQIQLVATDIQRFFSEVEGYYYCSNLPGESVVIEMWSAGSLYKRFDYGWDWMKEYAYVKSN